MERKPQNQNWNNYCLSAKIYRNDIPMHEPVSLGHMFKINMLRKEE